MFIDTSSTFVCLHIFTDVSVATKKLPSHVVVFVVVVIMVELEVVVNVLGKVKMQVPMMGVYAPMKEKNTLTNNETMCGKANGVSW